MALQNPLTQEGFHALVEKYAYGLWHAREVYCRMKDWNLACRKYTDDGSIFLDDPRYSEINHRADEIYKERESRDRDEDWRKAEEYISEMCHMSTI
jgi:hypothetical protein